MSEENVELARRLAEWFNAGDADAAQAHATDDVEIVPLRAAMEDTAYRGPGGFAEPMSIRGSRCSSSSGASRVSRLETYVDVARALQAAGLSA